MAYTQDELNLYVMYLRVNYTQEQAAYLIHLERRRRLEGAVPGMEVAREMLSNPTFGGSMNMGRNPSTPMLPAAMAVPQGAQQIVYDLAHGGQQSLSLPRLTHDQSRSRSRRLSTIRLPPSQSLQHRLSESLKWPLKILLQWYNRPHLLEGLGALTQGHTNPDQPPPARPLRVLREAVVTPLPRTRTREADPLRSDRFSLHHRIAVRVEEGRGVKADKHGGTVRDPGHRAATTRAACG